MADGADGGEGFLAGVRVLEVGNELGEYCGKVLAGLGAEVIKVEPVGGEVTRTYGPFYEDKQSVENSLTFWHYNFGKRGITLDLDGEADQARFRALAKTADVVIEARPRGWMAERGIDYEALKALNPKLVYSRISPFGDDGPWADFKGSDLVHLALGGIMMNCGYDPEPDGFYDTPPVAPQMWQAYNIAGEMALMAILGALYWKEDSGIGQYISTPVHSAVAQQTEGDVPIWLYTRGVRQRLTCRHSAEFYTPPSLALTKDGRYLFPYRSYAASEDMGPKAVIKVLEKYGMAEDLLDEKYKDNAYLQRPEVDYHISGVVDRFIARFKFDREIWREMQAAGQTWAPVRRPEENATDEHFRFRGAFNDVHRPELNKTFTDVGARWYCTEVRWRTGPRSPLLGEHNADVLGALKGEANVAPKAKTPSVAKPVSDKPFPLEGIKIVDVTWMVASAGAGRFLTAMGAEVVKVEHKSRWDTMRFSHSIVEPGMQAARAAATAPMPKLKPTNPNQSAFFMDINTGKRSISLNLKNKRGLELLGKLLEKGDVVTEGFSPGTMDRMGLGYARMKEINPRLVYVQQSGMGQAGVYGRMRSFGPVAQAFSGMSDLSGLPDPYPPAGIGYSYLDWFGAYNMANGILAGVYRQKKTGKGCWIDSSQVEVGIYLNGTSILDHSANGRRWARYGNRSPYKLAAPHGAFRAGGNDRWVAISCFTEDEWHALLRVLGGPSWGSEARFATLADRLAHQDALEALINAETAKREPFALMQALQEAGVPAGVCQTAEDRCEHDPQLKHRGWLIDLPQSYLGMWGSKQFPGDMSESPARMGGPLGRHGPSYAEDNERVYGEWLGLSTKEIKQLEEDDVI